MQVHDCVSYCNFLFHSLPRKEQNNSQITTSEPLLYHYSLCVPKQGQYKAQNKQRFVFTSNSASFLNNRILFHSTTTIWMQHLKLISDNRLKTFCPQHSMSVVFPISIMEPVLVHSAHFYTWFCLIQASWIWPLRFILHGLKLSNVLSWVVFCFLIFFNPFSSVNFWTAYLIIFLTLVSCLQCSVP